MLVLNSPVPPVDRPPKLNGCEAVVVARPNVPAGLAPNRLPPMKN